MVGSCCPVPCRLSEFTLVSLVGGLAVLFDHGQGHLVHKLPGEQGRFQSTAIVDHGFGTVDVLAEGTENEEEEVRTIQGACFRGCTHQHTRLEV